MPILSRNEKGEFEEVRYSSPTPEMLILSKLDRLKEELDTISSKLLITEAIPKDQYENRNETLVINSEYNEEWYAAVNSCSKCNTDFMCNQPNFCPHCGRRIIGKRQGNETVYYGNERILWDEG